MASMFSGCVAFNSPLTFTSTASVKYMNNMFLNCPLFNQNISSWNTVLVENMSGMFSGATTFNSNISSWSTGLVQNMSNMFNNATAFQQNLGSWDITSVTNFNLFMIGKTPATWPTTYFDNLLCGWSPQTVVPSLTIHFGSANYTNATGGPCRTVLQGAPKLWTILSGPGV
jgi:hypothetical protein